MATQTIGEAADRAKVSRRALGMWLKDAEFCAELRKAQSDVLSHAVRRLTTLSGKAINTLEASMDSDMPAVALRAADVVLNRLLALAELHDLAERITALEAAGNTNAN